MKHYLQAATEAALAAGELIRQSLGQYQLLQTKGSAHDLVTDVDRASEALISRRLLTAFPDHLMLGEEGMTEGPGRVDKDADLDAIEHLWVCDPIDGTTNFVHGIPNCTVAICLAQRGVPVLGVVYDPARDELFTAVRGQGAHLNGRPIRVRPEQSIGESLVGMGLATLAERRANNVRAFVNLSPHVRNIRNLGSAELHLAYVAAGRLTGFFEYGLSTWDMAAGYVLVTEAGGTVTEIAGAPYTLRTTDIVATNGPIHDELRRLIR